jgi:hypothetical protein
MWWHDYQELAPYDVGVYPVMYDDLQPEGLFYRIYRAPVQSAIKGIQGFPFIQTTSLGVVGPGDHKFTDVAELLFDRTYTIDEFTCIALDTLNTEINHTQAIAFVPTDVLDDTKTIGKWIYFTTEEISLLIKGKVTEPIRMKAILKG